MQKNQRKDLGKLRKQAIKPCNRKQFLIVPKLSEFGLIRNFRTRASICKKSQLKQNYGTQETDETRVKNMFKLVWTEGIITKILALVSSKMEVWIKRYEQKKFEYESEQISKFENFKKLLG